MAHRKDFWSWLTFIIFAPFVVGGLLYAAYILFSVMFGGASCQPTICQ